MYSKLWIAPVTLLVAAASSWAQTGITNTDHDLRNEISGLTNICLPCHTPHKADITVDSAPLWNHALTTQTFTMYTTLTGRTGDPDGPSKLCLSCHDGVTALDSYGGQTGSNVMTGDHAVGTDLRDDHPIGLPYPTTGDYNAATSVTAAGLFLFDVGTEVNRVECGSCHNPHNNTNGEFLRISNDASALCLTCHQK